MLDILFTITLGLSAILACAYAALAGRGGSRKKIFTAWNAVSGEVGTHEGGRVTRIADEAISAKHLLAKTGASGVAYVEICGANDLPLYVMTDEAAEDDFLACDILGAAGGTVKMVAAEAVDVGEELYTAANGRVQDLPVSAGDYYLVGRAVTAAGEAGELIEAVAAVPRKVTV